MLSTPRSILRRAAGALLFGMLALSPPRAWAEENPSVVDTLRALSRPDSSSVVGEFLAPSPALEDTIGVSAQVGMSLDTTNESYYVDAYIDTTFLGRRLIDTPETRTAGTLAAALAGTRDEGATRYRLRSELSLGNRLGREWAGLSWRHATPDWTWSLDPSAEHRLDRTFGRDLEEWRGAFGGNAHHPLADEFTTVELSTRADFLRSSGTGSEFQPDRRALAISTALDHLGLLGDEWRIGYRISGRVFPDSSDRDHFEHVWDAHWKGGRPGQWLILDAMGTRRVTVRIVPTTRDNFWIGEASAEGRAEIPGPWSIVARAEGEATRYDVEDSTLYFDYQVARAKLDLRWEPDTRWSLELGPRAEALLARLDPGEQYREAGGALDVGFLGGGSWWNLTPAAGWRAYDDVTSAGPHTPPLHSSYAFYALDLIADQSLGIGLRLKAITSLRWEFHQDPTQDARSVYASLELVRPIR